MAGTIGEAVLVEAIMDTRAQVDFLWQFFVTVQIAVFALLLIYDHAVERLSLLARIFAVTGIALFNTINGKALINTYQLMDSMLIQYRQFYGDPNRFTPDFYEQFVQAVYADRPQIVLTVHGIAFTVVTIALLAQGFLRPRAATKQT